MSQPNDLPNDQQPPEPKGDEVPVGSPQSAPGICPECGGSGRIAERPCPTCGGSGTINVLVGDA